MAIGIVTVLVYSKFTQLTTNSSQQVTHSCGQNLRSYTDKTPVTFNPLTAGAWNVRMSMDIKNMERPERSTVIVCRELVRFDIDVAALSETRHDEEGNIRETGSTYMIFWKGKETRKQYIHGASFAINKKNSWRSKTSSPLLSADA